MKKRHFVAFTLLMSSAAAACGGALTAEPPPTSSRFVFLIDTSASMLGANESPVIFPRVKQELKRFLATAPANTEVQLATFDAGLTFTRSFRLPEQRQQFAGYVDRLDAHGRRTFIYRSLQTLLDQLPARDDVATTLFLLTDGHDNDSASSARLQQVLRSYALRRGAYDWLYYVTLGLQTPPDVASQLQRVPRTRTLSAAPGQLPSFSVVRVQPAQLDLGNVKLHPNPTRTVALRTQGRTVPLSVRVESPTLERHGAFVQATLRPGATARLHFQLRNTENLPDGTYTAKLCFTAPEGAIVQPDAVALNLAYHPAATYTLTSTATAVTDLPRGGRTRVTFDVSGNSWVSTPLTVRLADVPEGLTGTVNGRREALVELGEQLTVELRNDHLPPGEHVNVRLAVSGPLDAAVQPVAPIIVRQPLTWWERWWWAALAAMIVLSALLTRGWIARRPWAYALLGDRRLPLRGEQATLDALGAHVRGVKVSRRANSVRVRHLPDAVQLLDEGFDVSAGESIAFDTSIQVLRDGAHAGDLTFRRP
ncbi:vWA domain-containing protein [Deinococcus yavapaiensis]|uniref:von Willebrand factor type A domain-containing protein n=1 Tax=Deinococcus yavapaiensis KR-236 TaxID=694435 RepID=A0A318S6D2_9DEIO|nr:vWA domain-containing protein [Deinococcus yavapaiensis]PYE51974.1 von Willebrand factor type A domain-containing protein [Deinococcus yavapaiensis KR-236]